MKPTCSKPLARGPLPHPRLVSALKRCWRLGCLSVSLAMTVLAAGLPAPSRAAVSAATGDGDTAPTAPKKTEPPASAAKTMAEQVRAAVESGKPAKKSLTLVINGKDNKYITVPTKPAAVPAPPPKNNADSGRAAPPAKASPPPRAAPVVDPQTDHQYIRARAIALTGRRPAAVNAAPPVNTTDRAAPGQEAHWDYEGAHGPQVWGQLKPEFTLCATGQRQSPIHIEASNTLQGPAEPLQLDYQPSSGSVVNNGRTIQVDLTGDNALAVRDTHYKLIQFHFHHPSEERVNGRSYAMVAHLVHQHAEGQLAVLAVLIDPGAANPLLDKVWTHLPLDTGDRVRLPPALIDMDELLPEDRRYYQFMGSLTTPPCSEGVLWLVLKQAITASPAQLRLFSQLFPNNARPVQPANGRAVREAQ